MIGEYLAMHQHGQMGCSSTLLQVDEHGIARPVGSLSSDAVTLRIAELLNRHGLVDVPLDSVPSLESPPVEGGAS